jgi:hypothetical protein
VIAYEPDRFIRRWFKGGVFMDGFRALKGLSFSDKTNIAMMAMSLVSMIVAVVSLNIAVKSYKAAQDSLVENAIYRSVFPPQGV